MSYFEDGLKDKSLIREKLLSLGEIKGLSHIKELLEDYGSQDDLNIKLKELYERMENEIEDFIFSDKRLLSVLNSIDTDTRFDFEATLSEINRNDLIDKINYHSLVFDDIVRFDDKAIQKIIIPNQEKLATALAYTNDNIKEKMLKNVSHNVRTQIEKWLAEELFDENESYKCQGEFLRTMWTLMDDGQIVMIKHWNN